MAWKVLIHLFLLATIVCLCAGNLIFKPRDTDAKINHSTYFNCTTGLVSSDIFWSHGTNYIYTGSVILEPYHERFKIERYTRNGIVSNNLIIKSVQIGDAGEYTCIDDEGIGEKYSVQLVVLNGDPICRSNKDLNEVIGQNTCNVEPDEVELSCSGTYHGNIPPQLEWKKDGDDNKISEGLSIATSNHYNYIMKLKGDISLDKSFYVCETTRVAQEPGRCISEAINVLYALSDNSTVESSIDDEITCHANTTQSCSYQWRWFQNNDVTTESNSAILKPSKKGLHKCEAECYLRNETCHLLVMQALVSESAGSSQTRIVIMPVLVAVVVPLVVAVALIFVFRHLIARNKERNVKLALLPKQNTGSASALTYFYGFLRIVLPDFKKRLIGVTLRYDSDLVPRTVQKMLIIIPDSCICADSLEVPNKIEFTGKFVLAFSHRAGNQKRDYKSSLYKLIDHEKHKEYYFVGEFAAPLLTMYETYLDGLCGMTKDQLYTERDAFYSTLRAILSHPDNATCNDQFKLLNWPDSETEKLNHLDIYNFLLLQLRKEIKLQQKATGEEGSAITDEDERVPLNELKNNDHQSGSTNVQVALLPKQDIGRASALNYFYGYLRIVLPDFKKRLIKETLSCDPDLVPKTVQKMLIILPESCFCATELTVPTKIEFTGKYVLAFAHRAGNQKRDYKSSLHKLIDREKHEEYYFVGEFATPLLTMYETCTSALYGMTKDQLYDERDAFCSTLRAILSHPDKATCNDQFKLLNWSDPETEKVHPLDIYSFLLPKLRTEIKLQQQSEKKLPKIRTDNIVPRSLNTVELLPVDGCNPASIYDDIIRYPMNSRPRGLCLIVNIANFEMGHSHLMPRRGAEKDAELLTKLFKNLHFEVQVHNDVNEQTLDSLFFTMQIADHTNYDAFVCCIMTHGELGVIYTSDGKQVEILQLVDYFTDKNCPTLKRKPKMFFIQACQKDSAPISPDLENGETIKEGISSISDIIVTDDEPAIEEDGTSAPIVSILDETLPSTLKHKAVLVPGSPDFLMSYSALPGSVSYRDTQTGSFYIESLCDCLRKGMEIDRALKMVSSSVNENLKQRGEYDGDKERFQLPFHLTSGMDKLIYL